MTRLAAWFADRRTLLAALNDYRRANAWLTLRLADLQEQNRVLARSSECRDAASHVRLAARAERAEALLAELGGVDPHQASRRDA